MKPLIQQMSNQGNDNVIVRGFEVNVNNAGNSEIKFGKGYYDIMYFIDCNNVQVYNIYTHDGQGDGLRIRFVKNFSFTIIKYINSGTTACLPVNVRM